MYRQVWLLLAVLAVVTLTMGTGGFSAVSLDRGVTMSVADHANAHVGLADPGAPGTQPNWMPPEFRHETPVNKNERTTQLFVVRNGINEGQIRVTAQNDDDRGPRLVYAETKRISASTGPEVINGTVECPKNVHGPATLELTVVVDDTKGALHAEIDYPVTVVCATAESTPKPNPAPDAGANEESENTKKRSAD